MCRRRIAIVLLLAAALVGTWLVSRVLASDPPIGGDAHAWREWLAEIVNVPTVVRFDVHGVTVNVEGRADVTGDGAVTMTDVLWVKECVGSTPASRPDCWGRLGIDEVRGVIGVD